MTITPKQQEWIINHFKNTKNDIIMQKMDIKHSALHRFARENGLKKTKQFQRKCQEATTEAARLANKRNNWPPKGYIIPKSEDNRFKKGIPIEKAIGKKANKDRIRKSAESRRKTVLAEKRRVLFGLPQRTKLKVVSAPHSKAAYRYTLLKRGYIIGKGERTIYYNENTLRSETCERTATQKYSFRIAQHESVAV
jgi:hypothetical protein